MLAGPLTADSITVHDNRLRKLSVIGPDLRISREYVYPFFPSIHFDDTLALVTQQVPTAAHIGYPVHVVNRAGTIIRSFGTDTPQFRADLRLLVDRIAGPAPGGFVWLAPPGKYVLEKWDPRTGRLIHRITPTASWFRESYAPAGHPLVERPNSLILQVREDSVGFVWVLIRDGDADWRQALSHEPSQHAEDSRMTPDRLDSAYDWVVEVLDAKSGRLAARYVFRSEVWTRPPNELFVTRAKTTGSAVSFDIWELKLITLKEDQ
jgi:hypothetical protein